MESFILLHVKLQNANQRLGYTLRNNYLQASVYFHSSPVTSSRERPWRHHVTDLAREPLTAVTREANKYRKHTRVYKSAIQ